MASSSGTESQLSVGAEASYLAQAPTLRAYEFLSEALTLEIDRIESQGLRNGRYIQHTWRPGNRRASGSISMELAPQGLGFWLERMLGAPGVTTGAGPYTHVFTPGDFADLSMTAEVARPQIDGVLQPFQYIGGYIESFDFGISNNEITNLDLDVWFADEILGTVGVISPATYPAGYLPFSSLDAVLSVTLDGGSAVELCISELSISGGTALDFDRFRTCTDGNLGRAKEPRPNGMREFTGSFTIDFEDMEQVNAFRNSAESSLQLVLTQGTSSLTIDMHVRYEAANVNVSGPELLSQEIEFKAVSDVSDAAAVTFTLVNDDATP